MAPKHYYHQIIKKTTAAFGTVFNNIYVRHKTENDDTFSYQKVQLAYGPIQQFLARLEQKPDPMNRVAITLPRMAFEVGNLSYDAERKTASIQSFNALQKPLNTPVSVFMPVPYNITFKLSIATKLMDDMLQILEQILPFFKPEYTLTVNLIDSINEKKDIPLILQSDVRIDDNYEGDFTDRRFLQCDLTFVAKIHLFGALPETDETPNYIKKVQVDYYTTTQTKIASRERRYTATPRAVKDYNEDETTTLEQDIDEYVTKFTVTNASLFSPNTYIEIGGENMYITDIDNGVFTVIRGKDKTIPTKHFEGDFINVINSQDDELIIPGDNFDFNEETFDFGDGKIFSPNKGVDV